MTIRDVMPSRLVGMSGNVGARVDAENAITITLEIAGGAHVNLPVSKKVAESLAPHFYGPVRLVVEAGQEPAEALADQILTLRADLFERRMLALEEAARIADGFETETAWATTIALAIRDRARASRARELAGK